MVEEGQHLKQGKRARCNRSEYRRDPSQQELPATAMTVIDHRTYTASAFWNVKARSAYRAARESDSLSTSAPCPVRPAPSNPFTRSLSAGLILKVSAAPKGTIRSGVRPQTLSPSGQPPFIDSTPYYGGTGLSAPIPWAPQPMSLNAP